MSDGNAAGRSGLVGGGGVSIMAPPRPAVTVSSDGKVTGPALRYLLGVVAAAAAGGAFAGVSLALAVWR